MIKNFQFSSNENICAEIYKIIFDALIEYEKIPEKTNWELIDINVREIMDYEFLYEHIFQKFELLIVKNLTLEKLEKYSSSLIGLDCCSKSFIDGDVIYSCNDCSMDPTCVLCEECFLNSIHKNHRFVFSYSSGKGGCCDCGDKESWKDGYKCNLHSVIPNQNLFDSELKERIKIVLTCLISYVKITAVPPFNKLPFFPMSDQRSCVVLFNDESHNFDEVIDTLASVLNQPREFCNFKTNAINHYGLSNVYSSYNYTECLNLKSKLDSYQSTSLKPPLISAVINYQRFQHMLFCSSLIRWIYLLSIKKNEILRILCHIVFEEENFVQWYIDNETILWKSIRHSILYYLFNTLLYDENGKSSFAAIYTENFSTLYSNFYTDTHGREFFIINLSVQFMTNSSVTIKMMEKSFMSKILACFTKALKDLNITTERSFLKSLSDNSYNKLKLKKCFIAVQIIEYQFSAVDSYTWSNAFTDGLMNGIDSLIDFLITFNNLDQFRKTLHSKDNDDEHSTAIHYISQIQQIMKFASQWIMKKIYIAHHVIDKLKSYINQMFTQNLLDKPNIIEELIRLKNVNYSSGSIFNFTNRFFIDILSRCIIKDWLTPDIIDNILRNHTFLLSAILDSTFSFAFHAQFFNALWRRNPDTLIYFAFYYKHPITSFYFFEQDFHFFQICAAFIDPSIFIRYIFFKTQPYLPSISTEALHNIPLHSIIINNKTEHFYGVLENILCLFYNLFAERHNVGNFSDRGYDHLKTAIIQRLAAHPSTRKEITSSIFSLDDYYPEHRGQSNTIIDNILSEVAILKHSIHRASTYSLKDEVFQNLNIFYYQYSSEEISRVYEYFEKKCEKDKNFRPNILPPLLPIFHGLTDFILSGALHEFLYLSLISVTFYRQESIEETFIIEIVLTIIYRIIQVISAIKPSSKALTELENFLNLEKYKPKNSDDLITHDSQMIEFLLQIKELIETNLIGVLIDLIIEEIHRTKLILDPKISQASLLIDSSNVQILLKEENDKNVKILAQKSKEASLRAISAINDRFRKNNPDWLLYEKDINVVKEIPTRVEDIRSCHIALGIKRETSKRNFNSSSDLFQICSSCRARDKCDFHGKNLFFDMQTTFVINARLKLSRLLSDHHFTFEHLNIGGKVESKFIIEENNLQNPHLLLSGCGHLLHLSCAKEKSISCVSRMEEFNHSKLKFRCLQCTSEYSINIPFFYPVQFPQLSFIEKRLPLKEFIYEAFSFFSSHAFSQPCQPENINFFTQSSTPYFDISKNHDILNPNENNSTVTFKSCSGNVGSTRKCPEMYFPNFIFANSFSDFNLNLSKVDINDLEKTYKATHDAFVYTLSCLEISNRNSTVSLFCHSFIESINFVTCSFLARFCFHGSGLGYFADINSNETIKFLQLVILSCSDNVTSFLSLLISQPFSVELSKQFMNIDFFQLFIDLYFGLSSLILSKTPSIEYENMNFDSLDLNCLKFCYIMKTIQIFINFVSLKLQDIMEDFIPISEDANKLFHYFAFLSNLDSNYPLNSEAENYEFDYCKKPLFNFWLNEILPFCRRCALTFYQLTSISPPTSLTSSSRISPLTEFKDLLSYLDLSFDFNTFISPEDMDFFQNIFQTILTSSPKPLNILHYSNTKISLIKPPDNFIDLVIEGLNNKCKKCNSSPRKCIKCLYCGAWICMGYECFCSETVNDRTSSMSMHSLSCGCSHGLYLNLKPPAIYFNDTETTYNSPFSIYEDNYGQSMLTSTNPLKFSPDRFQRLNYLYQNDIFNFEYSALLE